MDGANNQRRKQQQQQQRRVEQRKRRQRRIEQRKVEQQQQLEWRCTVHELHGGHGLFQHVRRCSADRLQLVLRQAPGNVRFAKLCVRYVGQQQRRP
jgi:hypothetical protein